ncbi:MAG: hexose kinase [Chitinivibrionales bacterium]|nr:hexose kinase [Chitinivibrionales bacterium]
MPKQEKILTLTMNPSIDITMNAHHVRPKEKIRCTIPQYEAGGGGINVARVIAGLGGAVHAVFPCGAALGDILRNLVTSHDMAFTAVATQEPTRQNFAVFDVAGEGQYRFTMPGPTLSKKEWQQCLDIVENFDPLPSYIVASGSLPPGVPDGFYEHIALCAHKRGSRFILDTSGIPLQKGTRKGVYLLKPNMREMKTLAGADLENEAAIRSAIQRLTRDGVAEVIILSLGAGGAFVADSDTVTHLHTPTVPIISTVGAGDSMVAGIVFGLSQGKDVRDAAALGLAAGAAAVMTPGTELCRPENVMALYKTMDTNML